MAHRKLPQEWTIDGDVAYMHIVRRSGEKVKVLASPEDIPILGKYRWCICGKGAVWTSWIDSKHTSMHSVVMGVKYVDHINRASTDNRRSNLRVCTQQENTRNRKLQAKPKNGDVRYKGVSYFDHIIKKPYQAKISNGYGSSHLGYFATPEEAADAYDVAAEILHGEFACTNRSLGLR